VPGTLGRMEHGNRHPRIHVSSSSSDCQEVRTFRRRRIRSSVTPARADSGEASLGPSSTGSSCRRAIFLRCSPRGRPAAGSQRSRDAQRSSPSARCHIAIPRAERCPAYRGVTSTTAQPRAASPGPPGASPGRSAAAGRDSSRYYLHDRDQVTEYMANWIRYCDASEAETRCGLQAPTQRLLAIKADLEAYPPEERRTMVRKVAAEYDARQGQALVPGQEVT
jgi:hypothetical protein